MREIKLNPAECSPRSLVFSLDSEPVFLCLDDDVKAQLTEILQAEAPSSITAFELANTESTTDTAAGSSDGATADSSATTDNPANNASDLVQASASKSANSAHSDTPIGDSVSADVPHSRTSTSPDPRLSAPLKMRPKDIQERVRAGATIAQLAEENEVTEARIEPYAHPVLLERARMAEMAKKAHPVRDDGPARLTLWEILATAFAARGQDLTTTKWDAFRDPAGQWVVFITWEAGHSTNRAEYSYLDHLTSSPTAVPRNALAQELVDPDFVSPGRSLTSVDASTDYVGPARTSRSSHDDGADDDDAFNSAEELTGDEGFLKHPDSNSPATSHRPRKAHTPHWEDVLLGVRAHTKRPRK